MALLIVSFVALVALIYVAEGTKVWLRKRKARQASRGCPRCGLAVVNGELDCPHCGFDFRTIGEHTVK